MSAGRRGPDNNPRPNNHPERAVRRGGHRGHGGRRLLARPDFQMQMREQRVGRVLKASALHVHHWQHQREPDSFLFFSCFRSFVLSPAESGETESVIDVSLRNFLQSHNKMLECFFFFGSVTFPMRFGLRSSCKHSFYVTAIGVFKKKKKNLHGR